MTVACKSETAVQTKGDWVISLKAMTEIQASWQNDWNLYSLIFGLFDDVISSDYLESNSRVISE